ncbi:MAG: glycosyltransferase family 39 protein [Bryobacterales bacterium]|nr:glycosyltransferase family 39 protein [Bryobacterales bacterium]
MGRWLLAGALAALAAAYWVAWRAPAAGSFHDDAVYLVTAKALAEGKGYRIISLPSEIAQTKYPPLLPLLLAGIWKLAPQFPENVPWLKLVPLLSTVAWLLLSYRLLREEGLEDWIAAWVCCMTAASTWVVHVGTMVLSEAPFSALTAAALLLLRRAERTGGWGQLAAAGVCAGLAFQTRTLGLAMLMAGPAYLALGRKWREAALFGGVAGLVAAPWVWWVLSQPPPASAVEAYYSNENYQGWNVLSNFAWGEKIDIVVSNLTVILFAPGLLAGVPAVSILSLGALAVGLVCVAGMWKQRRTPQVLLLAVYGAMVCAWAWKPTRFAIPFLPLLLWLGVEQLRARPRLRGWAMGVLAAMSAATLGVGLADTVRLGYPTPPIAVSEADSWERMERLIQEIRRSTPENAVLMGNLAPLYYLHTGRKAVRGFAGEPYRLFYAPGRQEARENPLGSADQFWEGLERLGATHWVESPNSTFSEGVHLSRMLEELRRRYPSRFEAAGQAGEAHGVYRMRTERGLGKL